MRIFSYQVSGQSALLAVVDGVCSFFAVVFGKALFSGFEAFTAQSTIVTAGAYAFLVVASISAMGLYDSKQRYGIEGALVRVLVGVGLAAVGLMVLGFLLRLIQPGLDLAFIFFLSFVLIGLSRLVVSYYVDDEVFRRRVLVYGAGTRAANILQLRRRSDQRGFRIVAFTPAAGDSMQIDDPRVVGKLECSLLDYARDNEIDEIVVAVDDRRKGFPIAELLECKLSGVSVIDLLEFLERESGRVMVDILNPSWLIFSDRLDRRSRDRVSFKLLDLTLGGIVLVLAAPLMLLIALLIYLDDGSPVFYRQERVGCGGRTFTLYKFRSMRKDAESAGQAVWAALDDPRVTRLGNWLRKLRLDELPQLINVMRGEMSMVGPRPERPQFVEELARNIPYYLERHYVKPGITGWAQLCYPYGSSQKDSLSKLEYDLYYIKNRSVLFYLLILLQTAEVVLWRKGSR